MSKCVLLLSLIVLLAGCDKAVETKTIAPLPIVSESASVPVSPAIKPVIEPTVQHSSTNLPLLSTEQTKNQAALATVTTKQDQSGQSEPLPSTPVNSLSTDLIVIDATSEQTMTTTLDKMIAPLTDVEKEAFAEAFLVYAMSKIDMKLDEVTNQKNMLAALHGKSIKDIIHEADKIKSDVVKPDKKQ